MMDDIFIQADSGTPYAWTSKENAKLAEREIKRRGHSVKAECIQRGYWIMVSTESTDVLVSQEYGASIDSYLINGGN